MFVISGYPGDRQTLGVGGVLQDIGRGGIEPGGMLTNISYQDLFPTGREYSRLTLQGAASTGKVVVQAPSLDHVASARASGGQAFLPAKDTENPQEGELIFDGQEVSLYTAPGFDPSQAISLDGFVRSPLFGYSAQVPRFLREVPLALTDPKSGAPQNPIEWSLAFGAHPSGSMKLIAYESTVDLLIEAFAPGAEFEIEGIGFRTGQSTLTQYSRDSFPYGLYQLEVALEGKWENWADEPFALSPLLSIEGAAPRATSYTLQEIAEEVGAIYQGPEIVVELPENPEPGSSTTISAEIEDGLIVYGRFPDWSKAKSIQSTSFEDPATWDYRGAVLLNSDFSESLSQLSKPRRLAPSPGMFPPKISSVLGSSATAPPAMPTKERRGELAIDYRGASIEGAFLEGGEEDTSESQVIVVRSLRRQPVIQVFESGDIDAALPPSSEALRDVSMNFDISGPTATLSRITTEDGVTILSEEIRYGFAFTAADILNVNGALRGDPAQHWKVISRSTEAREFDSEYGYYIGSTSSGSALVRAKAESVQNPETLSLEETDPEFALYEFVEESSRGAQSLALVSYGAFYEEEGASAKTNLEIGSLPSGDITYRPKPDPESVPALFALRSNTEGSTLKITENPGATGDSPLPPILTGKEEFVRESVEPISVRLSRDEVIERHTRYTSVLTAQDSNLANAVEETTYQEVEGRPGQAERKSKSRDKEQEVIESSSSNAGASSTTKLLLLDTGEGPADASGRVLRFRYAETLEQAKIAAQSTAYLQQLENGDSEQVEIPWNPSVRPGDAIIYQVGRVIKRGIVMSARWSPSLAGGEAGIEWGGKDASPTILEVALLRGPGDLGAVDILNITEVNLPGPDTAASLSVSSSTGGTRIGEALPPSTVSRTRGNWNG